MQEAACKNWNAHIKYETLSEHEKLIRNPGGIEEIWDIELLDEVVEELKWVNVLNFIFY